MPTELDLIRTRPAAHRQDLPAIKRDWQGRRVAVRYVAARGSYHRRTSMGWAWGVLVQAAETQHVAVRERGGRVVNIHYRRITAVYDLTRDLDDLDAAGTPTTEAPKPGVPAAMNPSRAHRLGRARGATTQWDAMREMCRAYND